MLSDYQKVSLFNECFDFQTHSDFSDKACLKLRLDLIDEELTELEDAYKNNDGVEERDACADILYVAYGMAYVYQVNSDDFMSDKYNIQPNGNTLFTNLNYTYTINDRKLVLEKLRETFKNLKNIEYITDKKTEIMTLLHEIIYLTYTFQYISSYDSDKIFTIVHDSNMSKLCKTEQEAQLTVDDYTKQYQEGSSRYDSPYYYINKHGYYVVKNRSTGKALKSINYIKVAL